MSQIERDIQMLEAEIKSLDEDLVKNPESLSTQDDFYKKYEANKSKLESLMTDWESVSFDLEQL